MKLRQVLLLLCIAAILSATAAFLIYRHEQTAIPANTQTIPYVFSVAEHAGVDVGTDMFRLGAVPPGNGAHRMLHVSETFGSGAHQRTATVSARGSGSEWIVLSPESGTLPLDVNVTLRVPPNTPYGKHEGMLLVTIDALE